MGFQDLPLSERLKRYIGEATGSDKLPNTIIVSGGNLDDRQKLCNLVAAALLCEGDGDKFCGHCRHCKKSLKTVKKEVKTPKKTAEDPEDGDETEEGSLEKETFPQPCHPDIIWVSGKMKTSTYSIKMTRILRTEAYLVPNEAEVKVYILSQSHSMQKEAQNSLLKVLEEPPVFTYFILECKTIGVMLPTVLSRAVVFDLGEPDEFAAAETKKEKEKLLLAKSTAAELAAAVLSENEFDMERLTAVFEKKKDLMKPCLRELILIFRDAMTAKYGCDNPMSSSPGTAKNLAAELTGERLAFLAQETGKLLYACDNSANANLLAAMIGITLKTKEKNHV